MASLRCFKHDHSLGAPSEVDGALSETILQLRGLLMMHDLVGCRPTIGTTLVCSDVLEDEPMRLSGIDLRVITGAIMVYLYVPLYWGVRRELSEQQENLLERVGDSICASMEGAYEEAGVEGAPTRSGVVEGRLSVSLEWAFLPEERALLAEVLDVCAAEMEHGGDVNIHFNGDEYGVRAEHLRELARRLL